MRNEENIGHIVRDKCMIISSLPTYKMSLLSVNSSFLREKRDTFATLKIRIKWAIKGIWWMGQWVLLQLILLSGKQWLLVLKKLASFVFQNGYIWLLSASRWIYHLLPHKLSVMDVTSELGEIQGIKFSVFEPI